MGAEQAGSGSLFGSVGAPGWRSDVTEGRGRKQEAGKTPGGGRHHQGMEDDHQFNLKGDGPFICMVRVCQAVMGKFFL